MSQSTSEKQRGRDLVVRLVQDLRALELLPGAADAREQHARRDEAVALLRLKVLKDLGAGSSDPLLVLISGGTNVGKSTVFNGLVGADLACPSPLARGTKIPLLAGHPQHLDFVLGERLLVGYGRGPLGDSEELNREFEGEAPSFRYALESSDLPAELIFIDSTDVDSDREQNLRIAADLILACDVVLFVVSPTKYRDEAVIACMKRALELERRIFVVWNPWEEAQAEALEHFRRSVLEGELEDGIGAGVAIHRLPPVRAGAHEEVARSLEELRAELRSTAADRVALRRDSLRRALGRLEQTLAVLLERLREEERILAGVHRSLQTGMTLALEDYRRSIQGLLSDQIRQAFKVLWQKIRVPLIDTTMDHAFALLRKGLWLLGFKAPARQGEHDDPLVPRDRVALRTLLQRLVDQVDRQLGAVQDPRYEGLTRELRQAVASRDLESGVGGLAVIGTRARREWLDARVAEMLETLKERPGRYYVATAVRSVLTIVPALFALWLVNWHYAAIIVLLPAVYGLMSQVVKALFFHLYVLRHRPRLQRSWMEAIEGELSQGVVRAIAAAVPRGPDALLIERVERDMAELRRLVEEEAPAAPVEESS